MRYSLCVNRTDVQPFINSEWKLLVITSSSYQLNLNYYHVITCSSLEKNFLVLLSAQMHASCTTRLIRETCFDVRREETRSDATSSSSPNRQSMAHEWLPGGVNKENRTGARERCIRGFKEAGNGGNHRVTSHPSRRNNYEIAPLTLDVMQARACRRGKTTREAGRPKKTEERERADLIRACEYLSVFCLVST